MILVPLNDLYHDCLCFLRVHNESKEGAIRAGYTEVNSAQDRFLASQRLLDKPEPHSLSIIAAGVENILSIALGAYTYRQAGTWYA